LLAALLPVFVLAYAGSSSSQGKGELVFAGPGGSLNDAITKAYLEPFEKETGVKIKSVEAGDNPIAAIQPQVQSGNVLWDYVACPIDQVIAFPELWEPLDPSKLPSLGQLSYKLDPLPAKYFSLMNIQSFLMAYSTKAFANAKPSSWADFFDVTKFPGPRGIPNVGLESATFVPMAALVADGVAPKDLFPLDLDRAYAKLDKLRPNIRIMWTAFAQSQDILRSGEVVMNFMTDGRAGVLVATGAPVGMSFNQAIIELAGFCIPKGAPNKENAFRLYEYTLSHPKQQAVFTSISKYGPPTDAGARESLALGVKDFTTLHLKEAIPQSGEQLQYVQKNSDMLLKRWNAWVEKK
jgi:spermidine/putrescine-binding protein